MSEADRLLPILAASGTVGMNRKQLGAAIDLEPEILDRLLNGYVQFGLVTVSDDDAGGRLYRIRPAASALAIWMEI